MASWVPTTVIKTRNEKIVLLSEPVSVGNAEVEGSSSCIQEYLPPRKAIIRISPKTDSECAKNLITTFIWFKNYLSAPDIEVMDDDSRTVLTTVTFAEVSCGAPPRFIFI